MGEQKTEKEGKLQETVRILKFVGFSVSAGIIEMASFTLLDVFTVWQYWPKYLIALVLSVLWNFTLNRKFTFQSANNVPKAMALVALFYLVFTPVTTILGNFLAEDLHWNEYLVTGLNMALNLSTEYLYDRFVVFRGSLDTNERAKRQAEFRRLEEALEQAEALEAQKQAEAKGTSQTAIGR